MSNARGPACARDANTMAQPRSKQRDDTDADEVLTTFRSKIRRGFVGARTPRPESASRTSSSITLGSLPSCMRRGASRTSPPQHLHYGRNQPASSKRWTALLSTTRSPPSATTFRKSAPRSYCQAPQLSPLSTAPAGTLDLPRLPEALRTRLRATHRRSSQPIKADARIQTQRRSQLDRLYQRVVDDLDTLIRAVGLKAA
jgi:hypothetical protein